MRRYYYQVIYKYSIAGILGVGTSHVYVNKKICTTSDINRVKEQILSAGDYDSIVITNYILLRRRRV